MPRVRWPLQLLLFLPALIANAQRDRIEIALPTDPPPTPEHVLTLSTDDPTPKDTTVTVALTTDEPETTFPSYIEGANWTGAIPAGIYFRISQKGINYITSLAAEALPQLLEGLVLPTVEPPQIKISKLTIEKFGRPTIEAKFINGLGIGAHVHLPQVMLSAVYDASTFFTTYKGKFKADVQNLTVLMEVHISRNESARMNIIETPVCNVTSSRVRIVFAGDMSTYLNLMRSVIEQAVIDVLGNELCQISVKVAQFFELQKQQILMTTPVPPPTEPPSPPPTFTLSYGDSFGVRDPVTTPKPEKENSFYETSEEEVEEDLAAQFASDLCANDRIDMGEPLVLEVDGVVPEEIKQKKEEIVLKLTKKASEPVETETQRFNPLLLQGLWAPDLTLMYAPKFTDKDVVFGLDGGIVFFGEKAKKVPRPSMLNISALGDQMFGLLISEYVPNTFFAHIHDNGLGTIRETVKTNNLPKFIKPIAKLLCSKCELQLIANLTGKPRMTIDKSGVKLEIEGDVAIIFAGKSKLHNVVNATTKLDIVVKPYLQHSRVYGDVALTSVDIRMRGMGVGGMFASSLQNALNAIVPRKLWPKIKKRLRFALNQRGIKLPVMCGVELERPSMSYVNHAIVIDTDFSYDLPRFVNKFKAYINAEVVKAKKKQQMESEEEYEGMRYI